MSNDWTVENSKQLYNVDKWGNGYFGINQEGNAIVKISPSSDQEKPVEYNIKEIVDQLIADEEIHPPVLLRFSHILKHRIGQINKAFNNAIKEYGYSNRYHGVYPIKVNQERHVVDEIVEFGKSFGFGLEVGSKPELILALGVVEDDEVPILCNGFKDDEYIETVLFAKKMGRNIIPIVEKLSDLHLIIKYSKSLKVKPVFGLRVKLAAKGAGRWESSAGYKSKFGLSITEVLEALKILDAVDMKDCLQLVHYHMGSQINNIGSIKNAVNEACRVFVYLYKGGAGVKYLDVGGGLGVDYDGTKTSTESSINYTLQEYANDIVFHIKEICDDAKVPQPIILSESGRALVAHHSVLVVEAVGSNTIQQTVPEKNGIKHAIIDEMYEIYDGLKISNCVESFHDVEHLLNKCNSLFNYGYIDLHQRSITERLYWSICTKIIELNQTLKSPELDRLNKKFIDTYFCNFSIFQSLPDTWAIDHVVPVMPIHRLNQEPTQNAHLVDITCDSDGKMEKFIQEGSIKDHIRLHKLIEDEKYLIGAFLVGAYQEVLGDIHNLFGDINAVHVTHDDEGKVVINHIIKGDTIQELLEYVHYDTKGLLANMKRSILLAVKDNRLTKDEAHIFSNFYSVGLNGYTYLEESRMEL
ncbi:MAG: arginine decarboxylase [Planctomycetota bacterium]|nr:MAG: arginine decarboxylase [Planctomycetota bacterium]